MMNQPEPVTIAKSGDWLVDVESGEIMGHSAREPAWRPTDLSDVEWVLERMQEADADVAAVELRLAALTEQLEAVRREKLRRCEWLQRRFAADLEQFAREKLEALKQRSLKTPFGTLSFRNVKGRLAVREGVETVWKSSPDAPTPCPPVVAWAINEAPAAVSNVQTRAFLISQLPEGTPTPDELFEQTPDRETFKIDTGVKRGK